MEFADEITELRKTSFTVSSIPVRTLKDFKLFCQNECNDNYATGIIQLLNIKRQWENVIPLLSSILREVEDLKSKSEESKSKLKTFGD